MPTSDLPQQDDQTTIATLVEVAATLRARVDDDGGFTVRSTTWLPIQAGIAVSADPTSAWRFDQGDWDDVHVAGWIEQHVVRSAHHELCVGGWLDRAGQVWLELVRTFCVEDRHLAFAAGSRFGQMAVYDLAARQAIPVRRSMLASSP